MQLIFHGLLRQLFGERVTMEARSIADAIEGFSRQSPMWPKDISVAVVGYDTEDKLKLHADEVHVMPSLSGGGGNFFRIVLGAALVVVGIFVGGPLGLTLIINGGLMIAQGVIGMFLKSPKIKGPNDPEASKYLAVNKNTTNVGTFMTYAWGRIDLAGHWLSLQSDSDNLSQGVFPAVPT